MRILERVFGPSKAAEQTPADPAKVFDQARTLAAEDGSRQLILVRPDLSLLSLACPASGSMPAEVVDQIAAIIPSSNRRNIAVITPTGFAPRCSRAEADSEDWDAVGKAVPFFGLLHGLACIGHAVWLFDGRASEIEAGCREADLLIVDSEVADQFAATSREAARQAMRGTTILIHDRASFQLRPLAPECHPAASWAESLDQARHHTWQGGQPRIVLIQPDQSLLLLPCMPLRAMTSAQLAQAYRIVPEGAVRNIAVIAPTKLITDPTDASSSPVAAQLRAAGRTIPFFDLLLHLASAGNPMWIFDGRAEALEAGCRQADLLFIDSALAGELTLSVLDTAAKVMRSENIVVYHRDSCQLAFLRSVSHSQSRLEFRDSWTRPYLPHSLMTR